MKSTSVAIKMAAPGIGNPLKWRDSRLSLWVLNLASLKAPQMMYKKTASQPNLPNGFRDHSKASSPGATPKATRSDRESNSTPNWLVVLVKRAIFPSNQSNIAEIRIAMAAASYLPWMAAIIA